MTDPADVARFAAVLDEALDVAQSLRRDAEALSATISGEPPEAIRASSAAFEERVEITRSVFERLLAILRHANHHTLESAYQELVADPGRKAEAERMQALIHEYKRTRAVISRSERLINDALLEMKENRWSGMPGPDDEDGSSLHAEA